MDLEGEASHCEDGASLDRPNLSISPESIVKKGDGLVLNSMPTTTSH